jgi:hypothetical protein
VPQRITDGVGVEGKHAVMFGGDIKNIVRPPIGYADGALVQRLRIDLAVDAQHESLAELRKVNVARIQNLLGKVLPGAGIVIVPGQHNVEV